MEKIAVTAESVAAWDLQALLRNPVRFGRRFLEPQGPWETLYTPINIVESNDASSDVPTKQSSESSKTMSNNVCPPAIRPSVVLFSSDRLQHHWTSIRSSAPGLTNVGNTCYLNSILQVLCHVPPFVQYLLSGHHSSQCQMDVCVFCKMEKHAEQCYPADGNRPVRSFKPLQIVSVLKLISKRFQPYRQEDAHEFLRCLLGEMQRSCIYAHKDLDFASQETTVIYKIFGGYLRQEVKCLKCNDISDTYPVYLDLSLDLMGASIEEALAMYVRTEMLTQSNRYKCEKCGILVDFQKQSTIYSLPPILTLHLKRFSFNKALKMSKITRHIRYGETLELEPYMYEKKEKSLLYNLIGVVVHSGNDTRCGHYYSFCKSSNGTWTHFNDEFVSTVSLQTVLKQQAYILIYTRLDSLSKKTESMHSNTNDSYEHFNGTPIEASVSSKPCHDKFDIFKRNYNVDEKTMFKRPKYDYQTPSETSEDTGVLVSNNLFSKECH